MATLQELNVRISADTTGLTRGVARAETALKGLDRQASSGRGLDQVAEASKRATAALDVAAQKARINAQAEAQWQAKNIEIARQRQQSAIQMVQAQQNVANSMTTVATSSTRATAGLSSVRSAMTSVAASALSTAPGVAQLGGVIGSMALGTGMMIAVMAGMAAIGYAWDRITRSSREAKKAQEEAIDQLVKAGRLRALGPLGETPGQIQAARRRNEELAAERWKLEHALEEMAPEPAEDAKFKDPVVEVLRLRRQKRLNAVNAEMEDLRVAIEEGDEKVLEDKKDFNDRLLAEQEATARKLNARSDMVRNAQQAAALAGVEGDAQKRLQIEYNAVNKAMEARRALTGEQLRLTLAAIEAEKKLGLASLDAARLAARVPEARLADSRRANLTDAAAGMGAFPVAPFEKMALGPLKSRNTVGRSDTNIWQQRGRQARELGGGAVDALAGGAMKLLGAFNPLTLLATTFGAALEPVATLMARLGGILAKALLPILEALWPVFKLVVIAATYVGQIMFKLAAVILDISAAIWRAIGSLLKALGDAINKLPGSLGNPLKKAGEAMLGTADALNGVADGFREGAEELGNAREEIKGLSWEDATAPLADAAREAAYNVSEAFDANRRRFQIGAGTLARSPFTTGAKPQAVHNGPLVGSVVIQAAPGDDGAALWRKFMDEFRLQRSRGGTTDLDLAILGVG